MTIIVHEEKTYNQKFSGYFGEFGRGGGAQIFFIQTAITPKDLDKISLIGDIEGSEKWEVRDLFQRDVDIDRVSKGLVPYLLDKDSIKFFNPLTLTFIPSSVDQDDFSQNIPIISPVEEEIGDHAWRCLEEKEKFRFRHVNASPQNGVVEWNDKNVKIVAIDGQHRLSALKNIYNDSAGRKGIDFLDWSIPVVLFGVRALDKEATLHSRTLDVIRRTFVYINTEAKEPSETRQILLTDSKVNEICTQEFLNYFHQNDCLPEDEKRSDKLPLLVFDWRGHQDGGRNVASHGSLKSIEEIRDWMEHYLLGKNWSVDQQEMLGIQPTGDTQELKRCFTQESLKPDSIKLLRSQFVEEVLPGLTYLLENFTPYRKYALSLREIERDFNEKSTESRHAFHKLRFGSANAHATLEKQIDTVMGFIVEEIENARNLCIGSLLYKDIGMRGVVYAFGEAFRELYLKSDNFERDFLNYSEWFTETLNILYDEGWFSRRGNSTTKKALRQICYDHNDGIINYRLDKAQSAFGALICMLISAKSLSLGKISEELHEEFFTTQKEKVYATMLLGFKKEVRPAVVDEMSEDSSVKEINAKVRDVAQKKTESQLNWLEKTLGLA